MAKKKLSCKSRTRYMRFYSLGQMRRYAKEHPEMRVWLSGMITTREIYAGVRPRVLANQKATEKCDFCKRRFRKGSLARDVVDSALLICSLCKSKMSDKKKQRSRRNAPVKIKRVGGAQAEMALKDLGLIKVDAASAERLFGADVKFFITNTNVNSYHFFKGWHLAMEIDPAKYKGENWTFKQMVNNWSYYNENAEMGKAAFFVSKGLVS